jgi:hypothetical protein
MKFYDILGFVPLIDFSIIVNFVILFSECFLDDGCVADVRSLIRTEDTEWFGTSMALYELEVPFDKSFLIGMHD